MTVAFSVCGLSLADLRTRSCAYISLAPSKILTQTRITSARSKLKQDPKPTLKAQKQRS
ncbi:MAG: hypothetical protein ACTTIC_08260 [Helicobacteraceae bacterium]